MKKKKDQRTKDFQRNIYDIFTTPVISKKNFTSNVVLYCFWRYLMRGLNWHLSQPFIGPQLILVRLWKHAQIRSCNQPVLSNKGKVSCSRKQYSFLNITEQEFYSDLYIVHRLNRANTYVHYSIHHNVLLTKIWGDICINANLNLV